MIPSDHFVRFYNEVFKFLDREGGLEPYCEAISIHQNLHCLALFHAQGVKGVYDYYQKIRKEENCDIELRMTDEGHGVLLNFKFCQSLAKALDNDAGACSKYCLHCFGWTSRVYRRAGLYQIYDIIGLENPQCCEWIYDDLSLARKKYAELEKNAPGGDAPEKLRLIPFPVPQKTGLEKRAAPWYISCDLNTEK